MPFFKKRGFTLVEMICVIAIMGIVISLTTINVRNSQATARDIVRKTDLQLIANALIAYNEDYGHFPTSIYDGETGSISAALNLITSGGEFDTGCNFNIDAEYLPISLTNEDIDKLTKIEKSITSLEDDNIQEYTFSFIPLNQIKDKTDEISGLKKSLETIESIFETKEKDTPLANTGGLDSGAGTGCNFNITTQGMCASSLKTYLVDNGYIQSIPTDPNGSYVNLQTNICYDTQKTPYLNFKNANNSGRNSDACYASTNSGCTQICKEGYTYISDGEHFALIAHMEGENAGNYETTACGSCALKQTCDSVNSQENRRETVKRDKLDQLPCDLTDEFTNTYECMINTGLVEYSTGEFYFYIY